MQHQEALFAPGDRVGRYVVLEAAGFQGLADRYVARADDGTEHLLGAIPAQHPDLVESIATLGLERVRHPNVLRYEEVLDHGRRPIVVTELVRGAPLRDWLERHGRPDPETATRLFRGLVDGLAAIHAAGFVHRDLRPETILVVDGAPSQARILDLGVATAVFALVTGGRSVTTSGSFMGQPHYWAPERARKPREADARSDLFSLGCILYELFAGVGPFAGLNLYDCYHATLSGTYRPLSEAAPGVPVQIQSTVERLLQPNPRDRLQSANEVMERLDLFTLSGDAPTDVPNAVVAPPTPLPLRRRTPTPAPPHRTAVPPEGAPRSPVALVALAATGLALAALAAWWVVG